MVAFFSEDEPSISAATKEMKPSGDEVVDKEAEEVASTIEVAVFRSKKNVVEQIPLEDYVAGVVSSEMSPSFEMEALKAQALAARTYILKAILSGESAKVPEGAIVTDTITHQVYHTKTNFWRNGDKTSSPITSGLNKRSAKRQEKF